MLTISLWACAAQQVELKQVPPSPEPLSDQPKIPTPKRTPIIHEDKGVLKEVFLDKKSNEKTVVSKDKFKNQPPRDKHVEEEQQNIDVSGLKHRLVGMGGPEIIKTMGFPVFRRLEPPARIWQYRTMICIVNIFLYETDRRLTAEYVESLGQNSKNADEDECFRSILKMRPVEHRGVRREYLGYAK